FYKHGTVKPTNYDIISPPDPLSNLRTIVFHKKKNELPIEAEFRMRCEDVQRWNQEFWTKHNLSFLKERKNYIKDVTGSDKQTLSADEMSVFYKRFLDENWNIHLQYNMNWYRKNIDLVVLALKVKIARLKNYFMSKSM
ncbi:hypothetical protein L9F63_020414, partial [Diploptera punctata]